MFCQLENSLICTRRLYLFIYDLRKLSNQAEIKVIKVQTNILFAGELTV